VPRHWRWITLVAVLVALLVSSANAAEWFVAATGTTAARGAKVAPGDIESALDGRRKVAAGDTLWLRGGTYKKPFELLGQGYKVRLAGREGAPIHIRPWNGEPVTIDGGLSIEPPSTHLWIRDLEITVSEPRPANPVPPDPTYRNTGRPWGGLNIHTGAGCRYIHLAIHDNNQGVSFWSGATDSELYGCLITDNGWAGTDRGHGHAVYTQNKEGVKTIADCIMTGGFGYTMHAYGSERADVDNYLVEGNICANAGPFLIGGGKPNHNIRVFRNVLFNVPMRLGYSAPYNEECEVRDNLIVNGSLAIDSYRRVVNEGNFVLAEGDPRPKEERVFLRPSKYDPRRAHLALFNPARKPAVEVDAAGFLKRGDRFRLMDPRDFYGRPFLTGRYNGGAVRVPVTGEFAVFVLLKDGPR
jgi:hypothetical protein